MLHSACPRVNFEKASEVVSFKVVTVDDINPALP